MTPGRRVPFATLLRLVVVSSMLFVWAISAAVAQTVDAAHGPLFGADARSGARRLLDLTVSMTEGRDDDLGADSGGASPLQPHVSGTYQDVDGALALVESNRRFSISARATGTARHTPGIEHLVGSNGAAAADLTVSLNRTTSLRTSFAASRVSNFAFDSFLQRSQPDETSASSNGATDAALDWTKTAYGGNMTLTRAVGSRATFSVVGAAGHSDRPVLDQRDDDESLSAVFARSTGRYGIIRATYTLHAGYQTYRDDRSSLRSHDAQLAAERTWRHSKFRRTVISLGAGPSFLQQRVTTHTVLIDDVVAAGDALAEPITIQSEEGRRSLRAVGAAALTHDLTRDWSAQAWYRRGPVVRDAIFFANTAGLDLRGTVKRRVSVTLSAGYSDAGAGPGTSLNRYTTAFGSTRLQAALSRSVALQAQYFLYHYTSTVGAALPEGAAREVNRRGVRVGIVIWAPVIRG